MRRAASAAFILAFAFLLSHACGGPGWRSEPLYPSGESVAGGHGGPTTMPSSAPTSAPTEPDLIAEGSGLAPPEVVAPPVTAATWSVDDWQHILTNYVTDDGYFRYEELSENDEDLALLEGVVDMIAGADRTTMSRDEELAFLMNAYNALVVSAVVQRWEIDSVMDVEGFFDGLQYPVAGEMMTLNQLENDNIRPPAFDEPRIHFLVNCASESCPPMAVEAITADNLEELLDRQARSFVLDTTEVEDDDEVELSQIFEWFEDDFGGEDGVREFLAQYLDEDDAEVVLDDDADLDYDRYDWDVNADD